MLAAIPLTPGGLGVVEAVLTSTSSASGSTAAPAAIGVLTYRFAAFWLPDPARRALAYASLKFGPGNLTPGA